MNLPLLSKRFRMNNQQFSPKKIFVDQKSLNFPLTEKILKNTEHVPFEVVENIQSVLDSVHVNKDPVSLGKSILLLTTQKGDFIKSCPCTPGYIGCNYFIINLDLNCPMNCSYCILQYYLSNPFITVHVNRQDLWNQLDEFLGNNKNKRLRMGTGELGDSLALDHLTDSSKDLISYFRSKTHVLFELKTKTVNIENLFSVEPAENIIISWSLNSEKIARTEEKGSPPVHHRIEAALRIAKKGFRVGFHFDPIIIHPGWEEGYAEIISLLFSSIDPRKIAWISLGSLRFPPHLKPIIQKRFPKTRIIYEEMIRGKDGKYRYFKPLRIELYRKIINFIKRNGGEKVPLYFCMESKEIWEKGLKKKPRDKEDVEKFISLPLGICR